MRYNVGMLHAADQVGAVGFRPSADPEAIVLSHIQRCRQRLTRQTIGRRLAMTLALGVIFPLLVIMADHAWPQGLPRWLLVGSALAWLAALSLAALAIVAVSLNVRPSALFAAQLLERVSGIRFNSLINALLLQRTPETAYACEAATRQAARDVQSHPPQKISAPGGRGAPLAVCSLVLAAWVLYALVAPKAIWPSLARFLGLNLPVPTATRLEWLHPRASEIVHAGDELRIEVAVHGRQVAQVVLDTFDPTGAAATATARHAFRQRENGSSHRWQLTLAPHEVTRDIHYRCGAGDAVLIGMIPVHPRPAIAALEIQLEPPAYTGWPVEKTTRPELDALVGTWATFWVQANVAARDPVFVLVGERETRTRMSLDDADPTRFSLPLFLVQSGQYRIEFSDRWGYPHRDPPQHSIVVRPDAPPTVEIAAPAQEETPDDVVDISRHPLLVAAAADDVQVTSLVLVSEAGRLGAAGEGAFVASADRRQARTRIQTAALALRPGGRLRVRFEARDNRVLVDGRPDPQITKTRVLTLVRPQEEAKKPPRSPQREAEPAEDGDQARASGQEPMPGSGEDQEGQEPGSGEPQPAGAGQTNEANGAGSDADAGSERGQGAPSAEGAERGDSGGAGARDGESDEFERELDRFVREHGEMARDVARRVKPRESSGADGQRTGGERGDPAESEQAEGQSAERDRQAEGEDRNGQAGSPTASGERTESGVPSDCDGQSGGTSGAQQSGKRDQSSSGDAGARAKATGGQEGSGTRQGTEPGGGTRKEQSRPSDADSGGSSSGGEGGQKQTGGQGSEKTGSGRPGQPGKASEDPNSRARRPHSSDAGGEQQAGSAPGAGGPTESDLGADEHAAHQRPNEPDLEKEPLTPPESPASRPPLPDSIGLTETIGLLEMLRRGEHVSADMLVEMGWPAERAAGFTKALERVYEAARRSGRLDSLPHISFDPELGEAVVREGLALSGTVSTNLDPTQEREDNLRRIAPPPEQTVPAHLRPVLEAYYRSLAQRRDRPGR